MKILAITTSTQLGSVAVVDGPHVRAWFGALSVANDHSETLIQSIHACLSRARLHLADLDAIAVDIGPGSFTGVRIGMATAKGLRIATSKPLIGVVSLRALCLAAYPTHGLVAALVNAHRNEVYLSVWRHPRDRDWTIAPTHMPVAAAGSLVRSVARDEPVDAIGNLTDAQWTDFLAAAGQPTHRAPAIVGDPDARWIGFAAMEGHGVRDTDDTLEPLYVRPADAKLPASPLQTKT